MARNSFGIPADVLEAISARDAVCVYCRKQMVRPYSQANPADSATIEHLRHDPPFYWKDGLVGDDIVICCGACNSSRGRKLLEEWFDSRYCVERNINIDTVSECVRSFLSRRRERA